MGQRSVLLNMELTCNINQGGFESSNIHFPSINNLTNVGTCEFLFVSAMCVSVHECVCMCDLDCEFVDLSECLRAWNCLNTKKM